VPEQLRRPLLQVLSGGELVEQGTPSELAERGDGAFAGMVGAAKQAAAAASGS
jgi:hypothetical protein